MGANELHAAIKPMQNPAQIELRDEERQPCEIWTRVMGYHRPMSSFNIGKKGEFHERKYFDEKRADLSA
ncbi:anaerobic ribonucleoside-triphosphate reductase [Oxalobacteraceae bacterium R-40]|uniref:Anaerobic ribonucleoside-triphosphate reductase n=1 Tax=Keguizhuia sedimenti TaxID=3064264 RepID=A0ABU1BQK9_9BURK|nr:anaerobic ribonucleoside-triphosphate reductase [Oxalobacteraceae bacterium R-40]